MAHEEAARKRVVDKLTEVSESVSIDVRGRIYVDGWWECTVADGMVSFYEPDGAEAGVVQMASCSDYLAHLIDIRNKPVDA